MDLCCDGFINLAVAMLHCRYSYMKLTRRSRAFFRHATAHTSNHRSTRNWSFYVVRTYRASSSCLPSDSSWEVFFHVLYLWWRTRFTRRRTPSIRATALCGWYICRRRSNVQNGSCFFGFQRAFEGGWCEGVPLHPLVGVCVLFVIWLG